MFANSRLPDVREPVGESSLKNRVRRHLARSWQPPIPAHTRQVFQQALVWRRNRGVDLPLILDSGCGTARSSVVIAGKHPQALVIGLDKSARRLERAPRRFQLPDNLLLLRADCAIFWLLASEAGWRLQHHYLLYPNPWPKPGHLKRRWHGHPVFPHLLALSGQLELRSNWRPYLEEFSRALQVHDQLPGPVERLPTTLEPLTDFEDKYQASGQALFRLRLDPGPEIKPTYDF